jgi:AraC-like DNA-binding protein
LGVNQLNSNNYKSRLKPAIHPSYARILCSYIKNQGYNIESLFKGSTLNWGKLVEQQHFISIEQLYRIILNSLELTQKPWLGIEIAKRFSVSAHGSLGYGVIAAPTVKDAFKLVERALSTRISLLEFQYQEISSGARFYVNELNPLQELQQVIYPMLIGALCDMIEKTTGETASGVHLALPYPKPTWFNHYKQQFPELIFTFGSTHFYADIPEKLLNIHSLTADNFAYRNAQRECQQLLEIRQHGGDLSERIKLHLFASGAPFAKQSEICSEMGMSVRTLIRKLNTEQTCFQAILDEVKTELACWQLQNTSLSVEEIAESVGIIDTSNFSRIFKRWMGCTPSYFRKSHSNF